LETTQLNKKKIFNDPIYGFISIPHELIYDLIEHPYFQRLRRINQLGLTHLVYPGALHTRFHHAMGAMHLMQRAIDVIRSKGHDITEEEAKGVTIAILLHDIGHGPFSHALEHCIVQHITHETISALIMDRLNKVFDGQLTLGIQIFKNQYHKKFLHQLVSSQLDMDRLDYLKRDSFYTGVSEGVISADRIISMLNVNEDGLCVEAKGIYSIEKFIIARRLMYWQVYLHKTVLSAEQLLVHILKRAKLLAHKNVPLFATPTFSVFLYHDFNQESFEEDPSVLDQFAALDDFDITASIKAWQHHDDKILSTLCKSILNRHLYKIELSNEPIDEEKIEQIRKQVQSKLGINEEECSSLVFSGNIANNAYNPKNDKINLLFKDGTVKDIAEAADQLNISMLSKSVTKFYLCYPKQSMVNNFDNL
jgi:hypothetical protein